MARYCSLCRRRAYRLPRSSNSRLAPGGAQRARRGRRGGSVIAAGGSMLAPPLLGRQRETAVLASLVDTLRAGRGGVVVVEGPAGIGKSRLLAEAANMAHEAGILVAAGRADEIEALVPLAPLLSALAAGPSPILRREELRALERPRDPRFWLLAGRAEFL